MKYACPIKSMVSNIIFVYLESSSLPTVYVLTIFTGTFFIHGLCSVSLSKRCIGSVRSVYILIILTIGLLLSTFLISNFPAYLSRNFCSIEAASAGVSVLMVKPHLPRSLIHFMATSAHMPSFLKADITFSQSPVILTFLIHSIGVLDEASACEKVSLFVFLRDLEGCG